MREGINPGVESISDQGGYSSLENKDTNSSNQEPPNLPLYNMFDRYVQTDDFLSEGELVDQTSAFFSKFEEMVSSNSLPDSIFFLDKSARPLGYMFRKWFRAQHPDLDMPDIRYVNIGGSGDSRHEHSNRPFAGDPNILSKVYGKGILETGTIAVVDEYSHTGQAINTARTLFERAFPEANVVPMVAYTKVPNWYQNSLFSGVEEYKDSDYQDMALEQVNREFGTNYTNAPKFILGNNCLWNSKPQVGVDYEHVPQEIRARFDQIYKKMEGSIPYTKRADSYYIKGLREARAELDLVVEAVIARSK